ncbi:MAG: hypothetical protein FWF31_08925 [Desulfobulbus sp.]|nr:hypothetical protein [Desulfobulbus sp.]
MKNNQRLVRQWADWQLVCIADEEYLLIHHDGFSVDFDAVNDGDAMAQASRLVNEIDGSPLSTP